MSRESRAIKLLASVESQARAVSGQAVMMTAASSSNMNAVLVGNPRAGEKQIPPEDAHTHILELLKLEIALNLHKILAEEAKGVSGGDYADLMALSTKLEGLVGEAGLVDLKARIKASRGQLADVIATNAVHMETGNQVEILSANEFRIMRSAMWRAGTAIRWEAPLIVDNAHTRVTLAHSLLQEAELLTQRAVNLIQTVTQNYAVSAENLAFLANKKVVLAAEEITLVVGDVDPVTKVFHGHSMRISQDGVDINPTEPIARVKPAGQPALRSTTKKHLELPQYEGMAPIPAFVTPGDEIKLQKEAP